MRERVIDAKISFENWFEHNLACQLKHHLPDFKSDVQAKTQISSTIPQLSNQRRIYQGITFACFCFLFFFFFQKVKLTSEESLIRKKLEAYFLERTTNQLFREFIPSGSIQLLLFKFHDFHSEND